MDINLENKIEIHRALYSYINEKDIEYILNNGEELYKEIFRLWNIENIKDNKELIKEITMEYVYKYAELKKRIQEVTTLLSISGTKEEFVEYYCRKFKTKVKMIIRETVQEMIKSDFTRKIEHALEYKNKT